MVTYTAKEILEMYEDLHLEPFLDGASQIFVSAPQPPEQSGGKGAILTSVNSAYVKSKRQDSKYKSFRDGKSRPLRSQDVQDNDGWTEVSKSGSGSRITVNPDDSHTAKSSASGVIPVSSNKFGDLLFESSESFFRDETPEGANNESPSEADGSKLVKLLELRRSGHDNTTPTGSQQVSSDLSLNAPSFTPLAKERPQELLSEKLVHERTEVRLNWVYLDPNGSKQGPFSSSQMASWFAAGYFPANLPVAWFPVGRPMDANLVFQALDVVYSGKIPFQDEPRLSLSSPESGRRGSDKASPELKREAPVQRGWLWSPEEDAKLSSERSKAETAPSLAEIMALEAKQGKAKK